MADIKTEEQRAAEWWDAWWAADYSWDGLAKKYWLGWSVDTDDGSIRETDGETEEAAAKDRFRPATLQDYWRDQVGDLIVGPDGKSFTRVHLPLHWRDGTPTGKAGWADDALDAILAPRLIAGAETQVNSFAQVQGADRRIQLVGAVLLEACTHPHGAGSPVHLLCSDAAFVRIATFSQQTLGSNARFDRAAFLVGAWFDNSVFSNNATFARANFHDTASFEDANFSGDVSFHGAAFLRFAFFINATFAGDAAFNSATFSSFARFAYATFSNAAQFSGATFFGNAEFDFVTFQKDAWFTAWEDGVVRRPASFSKLATFASAIFRGPAFFSEARFEGRFSFDKTLFQAIADFSKVEVPAGEKGWRAGFDGALFERAIDLRGVAPKAVSLVSGATFDRDVLLDRTNENDERRAHDEALALASASEDREDALKALESGALKLKQAMNAANDGAREQRFYRLELRARRKQRGTRLSERVVSGLYAVASGYGASLGRPIISLISVVMAFALWFWAWEGGAFSGGPAKLPGQAAYVDAGFVDSVRYSLSRTFPFGPWAIEDDRLTSEDECGFASRLQALDVAPSAVTAVPGVTPEMIRCRPRGGLEEGQVASHRLFVGVIGTLESLLSLPLYFLFGLSVRRKFQIS